MTVTRANVEAAKAFIRPRLGDPYVYGGMFTQDVRDGTDCSGVWNDTLGISTGHFRWGRESEGATTESYRPDTMDGPIPIGGVGPFGVVVVARPQDIPRDAVVKLAFHHGPGGGANSHMWGELDGMRIESAGNKGLVTAPAAWPIDHPYANSWAYLPGPITEDGTPVTVIEPPDTLYADVSEWQTPVTDAYTQAGYRVLCIRSNDGTYRDKNWAQNYDWCKRATADGRLAFFIVYFVWRPNWQDAVATLKSQVGQPHPRMAVMLDVESWSGQIGGDQSAGINAAFEDIATWLGDRRRVIGYGNVGDLNALWPHKPDGVRLVVAGYGNNPGYPGKIAHQYTDGEGWGGGLPEGAPPWAKCDMNSADGLTATAFAAALGIFVAAGPPPAGQPPAPNPDPVEQLGPWGIEVESLSPYAIPGEPKVKLIDRIKFIDAMLHSRLVVEEDAKLADTDALARLLMCASGNGNFTDAATIAHARAVLIDRAGGHPGVVQFLALRAAAGDTTAHSILTDIQTTNPAVLQAFLDNQKGA